METGIGQVSSDEGISMQGCDIPVKAKIKYNCERKAFVLSDFSFLREIPSGRV